METSAYATKTRIARNVSIVLSLTVVILIIIGANERATRPFSAAAMLLMFLSWIIFWRLRYGWPRMLIMTGGVIAAFVALGIAGPMNRRLGGQLVGVATLVGLSTWVMRDARKRGMSPHFWEIGVLLLPILFLPLYFWKRTPLGSRDSNLL